MDWMDFNNDGEVDAAEEFFGEEMLCASKEEHEALFGDAGDFDDDSSDDFDDELMIAPWSHDVTLRENDSLKIEEANVLENVPCKKGNFIAVDVEVLKDE